MHTALQEAPKNSLPHQMRTNIQRLLPRYNAQAYKGQGGKIGVVGGSFEYTGAPYYAAVSSLKGGGELAHIFCTRAAATPIKSYSPENIVHPVLASDDEEAPEQAITKTLEYWKHQHGALHTILMGPGLGRGKQSQQYFPELIAQLSEDRNQTLVIDADGLWHVLQNQRVQKLIQERAKTTILTPNAIELQRFFDNMQIGDNIKLSPEQKNLAYEELLKLSNTQGNIFQLNQEQQQQNHMVQRGLQLSRHFGGVTLIIKGPVDIITDAQTTYVVTEEGSHKRTGGLGDILSGLTALYAHWSVSTAHELQDVHNVLLVAGVLASYVTRLSSQNAFKDKKWSLTAPDVISKIGESFWQLYEDSKL